MGFQSEKISFWDVFFSLIQISSPRRDPHDDEREMMMICLGLSETRKSNLLWEKEKNWKSKIGSHVVRREREDSWSNFFLDVISFPMITPEADDWDWTELTGNDSIHSALIIIRSIRINSYELSPFLIMRSSVITHSDYFDLEDLTWSDFLSPSLKITNKTIVEPSLTSSSLSSNPLFTLILLCLPLVDSYGESIFQIL